MLNLSYVLHPPLVPESNPRVRGAARWLREQLRYRRAMRELNALEDAMLEDIGVSRADFPALARRHARGLPPLERARAG
jgi:uncharacterized protein YjiS (DUF1127 family)